LDPAPVPVASVQSGQESIDRRDRLRRHELMIVYGMSQCTYYDPSDAVHDWDDALYGCLVTTEAVPLGGGTSGAAVRPRLRS